MGEELSSKLFYRQFKSKHSNCNINDINIVPNWDVPEIIGCTSDPKEVAEQITRYWSFLYKTRPTFGMDNALDLLRDPASRRVSKKDFNKLDAAITIDEVRNAIAKCGLGKSPGPDGLPAEVYREFTDLLAPMLLEVLTQACTNHDPPPSFMEGNITLLYKKGSPREIRNYRPITLLNTDYKIYTKILGYRLNPILDSIISKAQLGFVPDRLIQEATHLTQLVQAYLDETDEGGLLVFLDMEKAFDSVSWEYLIASMPAIGIGPKFTSWVSMLYNEQSPPTRRVLINGVAGEPFKLGRGTAQGCPCSPILFLLVAETLTRMVEKEGGSSYRGARIGGIVHRISQFADDTCMYLRSFADLPRMWAVVGRWEQATGMRCNVSKSEGITCGRLRGMQYTGPGSAGIKWLMEGEHTKYLGIPIGVAYCVESFVRAKYNKMKALAATWLHPSNLTQFGRAMIANSLIFSRFRYIAQNLVIPTNFMDALQQDTQALIWNKEVIFDADEIGTPLVNKRYMKEEVQYSPKKELGLGMLHWVSHVKALQSIIIFRYLDASQGAWKQVLDAWFGRSGNDGRGAVMSTCPISCLTKPIKQSASKLPSFFIKALASFRELKFLPVRPGRFTSREEARAEPLWRSLRYNLGRIPYETTWQELLDTNRLGDIVTTADGLWDRQGILDYIKARLEIDTHGHVMQPTAYGEARQVKIETMLKAWDTIINRLPEYAKEAVAQRGALPTAQYSTVAHKLMAAMGWKGGPLKKGGLTEPIQLPGQTSKAGIGHRKGTRKPRPKANIVLFGSIMGNLKSNILHVVLLSARGRPVETGETIDLSKLTHTPELQQVVWWGRGILGPAAFHYPHPKGWTIDGASEGITIDMASVRILTAVYRRQALRKVVPTCITSWTKLLRNSVDGVLPFYSIADLYRNVLLTPKDYHPHFKNILHRRLRVRSHAPHNGSDKCRCCGDATEHIIHIASCRALRPLFERFAALASMVGVHLLLTPELILLGVRDDYSTIARGLHNLLIIIYKMLIIQLTTIDVEGAKLSIAGVWKSAGHRLITRVNAKAYEYRLTHNLTYDSSRAPPSIRTGNAQLTPLGQFSEEGHVVWKEGVKTFLTSYDTT